MITYIISRVLSILPVALLVTVGAFAFIHLLPGDPVVALIGSAGTEGVDERTLALRRHELGLDRPLPVQYADWLGKLLRGDLGRSAVTHQPVSEAIVDRFPVTLQVAVASFVVSLLIALPAAVVAAYRRNSPLDRAMTVLSLGGVAMPSFWLGILLILVFAVELRWFPPSGFVNITTDPLASLHHLVLPAFALGAVQAAVIMRQARSSLLEVLNEDYIRTARAKGLAERRVVLLHGLRNALLPVVTILGLQVSRLLGGSVIIESVFAIPGFARYGVDAIFIRDYPVVQAVVLVTAIIVVLANLLTDLLYGILDPRIQFG
jgi:peptide/nickel transport system permease protein